MPYGTRLMGERDPLPSVLHDCYRCGIRYRDSSGRWTATAPCSPCRDQYRIDGVDLDRWRTPRGLEEQERIRARTPEQLAGEAAERAARRTAARKRYPRTMPTPEQREEKNRRRREARAAERVARGAA